MTEGRVLLMKRELQLTCPHNAENPSSPVTDIMLFNVAACVGEYNKPDNYESLSESIRS
jgi:hypothetical protein